MFGVSVFMIFGGTMCGLEEEAVAFYPILAPIFIALGYDPSWSWAPSSWPAPSAPPSPR